MQVTMDWRMPDGSLRARHHWPCVTGRPMRAAVLLVHGLGEHAGRHARLATWLARAGFDVHGFDQSGHGRSPGHRGRLDHARRLPDDLAAIIDALRAQLPAATPLLLHGHSMGGLVAARFVAEAIRPVDGLLLSSPAIDPGMHRGQRLLAALLARIAPGLAIGNGLDPARISHDPAVVAAYRDDPWVHDRISGRLADFIARSGAPVLAAAPNWSVPTLLLYAGDDHLVAMHGSARFAAAAPPGIVEAHAFPALYQEIFNEPDAAAVFDALQAWLARRFPEPAGGG